MVPLSAWMILLGSMSVGGVRGGRASAGGRAAPAAHAHTTARLFPPATQEPFTGLRQRGEIGSCFTAAVLCSSPSLSSGGCHVAVRKESGLGRQQIDTPAEGGPVAGLYLPCYVVGEPAVG